jgi:ABC-type oligopeptide transport system substrate-binding subunit
MKRLSTMILFLLVFVSLVSCASTETGFEVTFDTSGGTSVATVTISPNDRVPVPDEPDLAGHDFVGWTLDGRYHDFDTPVTEDIVLKAVWRRTPPVPDPSKTYRMTSSPIETLNPHDSSGSGDPDLHRLVTDTLYALDYDWDLAINSGLAAFPGDFTFTELLPSAYVPSMADAAPEDVFGDGLVWEIVLKSGLIFSNATPITSQTFSYSYAQLLDPLLAYADSDVFLSSDRLPLEGAAAYVLQETPVSWETVGFQAVGEHVFRLRLTEPGTAHDVMAELSSVATSAVHPLAYEAAKAVDGTSTAYGSETHPVIGSGPYMLDDWSETMITFVKNIAFHDASRYRIGSLSYVFTTEGVIPSSLFLDGEIDVVDAGGPAFTHFIGHPELRLSPQTSHIGLFINIHDTHPLMGDAVFRKALYHATDREKVSREFRPQSFPLHGFIGPSLHTSSESPFAYRSTPWGQSVLETYAPARSGYDRTLAKTLFDQAYDDAIARGAISAGDVVSVTYTFIDNNSGRTFGNFLKNTWELAFSPNRFNLVLVPQDVILYDPTDHDIHFSGLVAHPNGAIAMLMAMSDLSGQAGSGTITVDLAHTKNALETLMEALLEVGSPSEETTEDLATFNGILGHFDGTTFTGTYSDLADGLMTFMSDASYSGREEDLDRIAGAVETNLFSSTPLIPLFVTASQVVYSTNVHVEMTSWHARIPYGDLRYIYMV